MPSPHPLQDMFQRTDYRVRLPAGGCAVIRIGEPLPPALHALLPAPDARWAFITACNPRGRPRDRKHNRHAMRALCDALASRVGEAAVVRAGCGVLGPWREPSLFVAGAPFALLDDLMRRFDQLAIVRGTGASTARLHWCPDREHGGPAHGR